MAEPILPVEHLVKGYGENTVLDDVSFSVRPGEVVVVVGPSGCGKSTLLRCINALEPTQSGRVRLGNETVAYGGKGLTSLRQRIGMVFQSYELFPHMTVLDNVLLAPTKVQKRPKAEVQQEAEALLDRVGLLAKKNSYPRELSGGQKKRVAIAGVLAMNPKILILDEPTAGLDPKGRDDILDQIAELHKVRGITIILVSHSMEDIAKYAERLIVVNDGEIAYDDAPKAVFAHYRELEAMGLAAPQITYIMHALKEKGLDVDVTATTVDEAKENILAVLRKCNPGKLSGDKQSVSDSQSKKENAKAETLISEMEADLTEDGTKESHSDVSDEDLSIQNETMDKKSAEQEENEGGQEV